MRAARLHSFTSGSGDEVLSLDEVEDPTITDPHDVIVRIAGAGVCRTDLHILEGAPVGGAPVALPHILGHENAGFVEAVGSAVTSVEVGDPILCYPFLTSGFETEERFGLEHHVSRRLTPGINASGGYAELLKINERSAVVLPPGTDPTDLAPLTDAGLAAYRACRRVTQEMRPTQAAYVVGAGGLGHLALQILGLLVPATVVVIEPKPEARSLARRLGADEVFATFADAARGSAPRPSAILDFVGSDDTVSAAIDALPTGGRLELVGVGGTLTVATQRLVEAELTIAGSLVGTYAELVELTDLVTSSRIEIVTTRYPLAEAATALDHLREGRIVGRAVLTPR